MKQVVILGAGPSGLAAAEVLARQGVLVEIYDHKPTPARKFLMAGRGGLNITHSEDLATFLTRYRPPHPLLLEAIRAFPPEALRAWCAEKGVETFVGSSGRVFPRAMKASPLLRAWIQELQDLGVTFHMRHKWTGWDQDQALLIAQDANEENILKIKPDAVLFALGGASWPHLGSDGTWAAKFKAQNLPLTPLRPSNCGFCTSWTPLFATRFAGTPLKSVRVRFENCSIQGDVMITQTGVEGGPIYALSSFLRDEIERNGRAELFLDLRPMETQAQLQQKLAKPRGSQSLSSFLRKSLHLPPEAIHILREATQNDASRLNNPAIISQLLKNLPLPLTATAGLDRAISSAGGLSLDALDENFMIRALPRHFAAGEMLDWEAPTGGYLLQACLSTGRAAAQGILRFIA